MRMFPRSKQAVRVASNARVSRCLQKGEEVLKKPKPPNPEPAELRQQAIEAHGIKKDVTLVRLFHNDDFRLVRGITEDFYLRFDGLSFDANPCTLYKVVNPGDSPE